MRGPRLYWRLFLSIAATIVLFSALGLGTTAIVLTFELRDYVQARHSPLGREAADVLARSGEQGLRAWLQTQAQLPEDVSVYILDTTGRDIAGRALPRWSERTMRSIAIDHQQSGAGNYQPTRLAPLLVGSGGEIFTLFVLPKGIGPWGSRTTTLGLIGVALLVIGTAAWVIARALTRPITELQFAARSLASGRIDVRVPARISSRHDELGQLAADFNSMAARIEMLLENRQRLLRDVSHELRSPLMRLQAATSLAAHRGDLAPIDHERIDREIQRMDRLIGDILRFSRLDDVSSMARKLVRVEQVVTEVVQDSGIEAQGHGVTVALQTGADLAVVGDPDLLRSACENVIRNAIRHSPRGERIEVAAETRDADVRITVSDRGPGVPDEHLERIFDPWFRVPGPAGVDAVSNGLGLAIVRRICGLHGGRAAATRRAGGGLTVTLYVPAAQIS